MTWATTTKTLNLIFLYITWFVKTCLTRRIYNVRPLRCCNILFQPMFFFHMTWFCNAGLGTWNFMKFHGMSYGWKWMTLAFQPRLKGNCFDFYPQWCFWHWCDSQPSPLARHLPAFFWKRHKWNDGLWGFFLVCLANFCWSGMRYDWISVHGL